MTNLTKAKVYVYAYRATKSVPAAANRILVCNAMVVVQKQRGAIHSMAYKNVPKWKTCTFYFVPSGEDVPSQLHFV